MKRERLQTDVLKWTKYLLIVLLLLLVGQVVLFLRPVWDILATLLGPLCVAFVSAYLLHPIVEWFVRLGLPRALATFMLFLAFILAIAAMLFWGLPALAAQVKEAMDVLPGQLAEVKKSLLNLQRTAENLPNPLDDHVGEWSVKIESFAKAGLDQIEQVIIRMLQSFMTWIVVPFLVFYLLKDYELLKRVAFYLTPRKWRKGLTAYANDVDQTFGSYVRGQLLVAFCVGVLSTVALWILGVPYPIVLGFFVGATDFIPYFGAIIGAIPAVGAALLESTTLGLYTVIALVIIQQIEGNLLSPVIVGRTVHLHPMIIIIALLIGVEAGGIVGLLIAVPVAAILKVTVVHIRQSIKGDIQHD
ncbi:AI-2E family transporter [Bacillus sp. FSL R5-0394]